MSAPLKSRRCELIDRHLLGIITVDESSELETVLANSREARSDFRLRCNVDAALRQQASSRSQKNPAPVQKVNRAWFSVTVLTGFAALVALVVGSWWLLKPREGTGTGVALLARSAGAEWVGESHDAGGALPPGSLRLKSGAVLVEFYSGAHVVVEGPADFQLVSANEAFLHVGKINAHVPPQAHGFTVASSGLTVVDHGTDFGVEVRDDAPSEVHVFKGNVEVATARTTARALNEGEAVRLNEGALNAIPAQRSSFMTEEELVRRDAAEALKRFAAWREARRTLSADPAMVIHYSFDETSPEPRMLTNQAVNGAPDTNGNIVGSSWTEGRWTGKRALAFRREGDRVRIMVPKPLHAVTLLAWVRVDSLPRGQNILLSADSEQMGALRWILTNRGELRLEIARDLGRPRADWEAVNGGSFVTPDRFGQWLLLATTFDGKTIRHFANGELIGSGASFTPPSINIGTAELANWRGDVKRNLSAAFDEFAVLSRTMNKDELRRMFEAGKP
jgi:hypothetical protein